MTPLTTLIGRILDTSAGAPGGADIDILLGDVLREALDAAGWALYRSSAPGSPPQLICSGSDPSLPFPAELPPAVEVEAGVPGAPLFLPPPYPRNGPVHFVLPFADHDLNAMYLLRYPAGTGTPPLDPGSVQTVAAVLSRAGTIGRVLRRSGIHCRGLEALSTLSRRLSDTRSPTAFLEELTASLQDTLGASSGCIRITHPVWADTGLPELTVFPGQPPPPQRGLRVFETSLRAEGESLGTLSLQFSEQRLRGYPIHGRFLPGRAAFFETISEEISLRLMHHILHLQAGALIAERQKRLQELWILQETNNALRGTLKLNRILKMILAGATAETGLGFNRAALFLLNERTNLLQGMLGVGPDSAEEAHRIWESLSPHSDLSLAKQIELYAETQPNHSRFDTLVKGIRLPVGDDGGTLSSCVRGGTAMRGGAGVIPAAEKAIAEKLSMKEFAATPIIAREQVFGLVVVDNLFDGKAITDEDLRLLSMFAAQAGLAIANAKELRAHKRSAEELRQAREMLIQTERLALLGEIAAGLAHEIRNPLVTIGGFARRLEKKLGTRDPGGKYAEIIASEVQRLEQFLEEILLFGHDRQPRLLPVQVNEIIRAVTRLLGPKFTEESIVIVEDLSPSLPPVPADANQLHQVLINLLSNAMEAIRGGGRIFIRTAFTATPPAEVTFTITDSGGGVEPEVLGNIFNPFFTTKSGGHGLGLALTQRIVTAHSGRLSVRNHPGKGLTLGVALPLPPEPGLLKNSDNERKTEKGVRQ